MTSMHQYFIRSVGLMLLLLASAVALSSGSFPGHAPDRDLIKTQRKVDKLFEKGDYERALFIYRDELAPLGDKFAQYMVGYMHYSGRGVPKDRISASAWYRLAAERGEKSFVKVRDVLHGLLNDEQRSRADNIYVELRSEMGDIVLIIGLINQDVEILRQRRGNEAIFGNTFERSNFGHNVTKYQEAADRLEERINYLVQIAATDQFISDAERSRVDILVANGRRDIDAFRSSLN